MSAEAAVLDGSARWALHEGEALAWLCSLPTACADAIVTDPPYSSGGQFRGDRMKGTSDKYVQSTQALGYAEFSGDNRDQRAYLTWCALWLSEALRVVRPGGLLVCFTDWRQLPTTTDAVQAGGWVWRGVLPWVKAPGTYRPSLGYANRCEYAVWGTAGPHDLPGSALGAWAGAAPTIGRDDGKIHPTQKPEALLQALLVPVPVGGVVVDPFAGSGTTGAAALSTGRRFLGCELSAHYAAGARERLGACESLSTGGAAVAGQAALFAGGAA
jgi:site-specific DNA-methyltransferase (adenine-specific)